MFLPNSLRNSYRCFLNEVRVSNEGCGDGNESFRGSSEALFASVIHLSLAG